jgi:hypothetical protein
MGISDEVFFDVYQPIENHLTDDTSWNGTMFETYGEDVEFVSKVCKENPKRIWTLVEKLNGNLVVIAGMHFVNRMGYFITKKDWVTGEEFILDD